MKYEILLADDDDSVRLVLHKALTRAGHTVRATDNAETLVKWAEAGQGDIVVTDVMMGGREVFESLPQLRASRPKLPVIIISANNTVNTALKSGQHKVFEYVPKPFDLDELFTALRNASRISKIQNENNKLKENLSDSISENSSGVNLIAESPSIQKLQRQALKIAKLDSTILLTGESGTGKSVFARYIHANSSRSDQPFITVSCPALPRELLESELFGHEKGAFTGAIKKRIGKIEAAEGGTLFLDEIGDLPLDLQPKLLNVLQDQEFTRIGGDKVIKSNVRIITATNINFQAKIANREFREDLYYRISVIPLELPALRNQLENILPLTKHFLTRLAKNKQTPQLKISADAMRAIQLYQWPGNIRQLENLIERAAAFCSDNKITTEDLPAEIQNPETAGIPSETSITGLAGHTLAEIEIEAIAQTLKHCGGNKAETARRLGISEKSIYNKMKRHASS